jgi:RHS repeat-associated protein
MRLFKFFQLLLICALATSGLLAQARVAENVHQEKFSFENTDCICVCALQAQTEPREFALFPVASVSGETYYNYFRTYQPNQGRYTQNDPIGLEGGMNRFGYVEENPLSWIDPLGLDPVGHHFVPQSLWKNEPLLPDTRRVFDRATTGPIPGGHNYGDGHNKYNEATKEMYEKWKTQNKIQCETMTPKQADDFVRQVKQSTDPRIRDFNNRIYQRIINGAFRRIPGGRGANE